MSDFILESAVVEKQIADIINTNLQTKSLMKIDNSLKLTDGMKKTVYKYMYTGQAEDLTAGVGSTPSKYGEINETHSDYNIVRTQHPFKYTDDQLFTDKTSVIAKYEGAAQVMLNDINAKFFAELAKITNNYEYAKTATFSYDTVVDALAQLNLEIEDGLFLVVGNDLKATLRKDPDFKSCENGKILHYGEIGSVSGLPVLYSKLVPAKTAYIVSNGCITMFNKADGRIEQKRDVDTKITSVFYDRYSVIALTDESKSIKITQATA